MRKGVDYPGVTIVYFCHDGKGNHVMAKRSTACRDEHGCWDIGGGGVDFGETVDNTIRREILEEYGTTVLDYEFLGYRDVHREHLGQRTHWIALDFAVLVKPDDVRNGEPHKFDDVQWFTRGTLPDPVHSRFPEFLELYGEKLDALTPASE
jgi:8-oxo-dGTP pyrophosphatase MutT (NUDIX family)